MHAPLPLDTTQSITYEIHSTLWPDIQQDIRAAVGEKNYELWFPDYRISSVSEGEVVLRAPGSIYALWVEENFKPSLIPIFQKYFSPCENLRFEIVECAEEETVGDAESWVESEEEAEPAKVSKKVFSEKISEAKLLERGRSAGLSESYSFGNFVVGENSELACAAARAVSDQPGKTYQPLYFHSACGLGKTHLLHAIGWESLRLRPKSRIIYVSAEQFSNDYIDAIRSNSLVAFRKRYREADLLLIDDVQFLGSKDGFQKEFFHTFNRLADRQRQIVLASDCPASEIVELDDRLASRFQWGLTAEIHRPGQETRAAILRRKRDDWKMTVGDDIIDAIVERVRGNVRVLEGALIRVAMVSTMNEDPIQPSDVPRILSDICADLESAHVDIDQIKLAVCEHYDVTEEVLVGKKRTARIAEARHVAMYLARTMTDLSLMDIAGRFGKEHGTVMHAVKKVKAKMETSASFQSTVELIRRRLVRGRRISPRNGSRGNRPVPDKKSDWDNGRKKEGKKPWDKD